MLQVRLFGQFDLRADGKKITIPTRAGQSLFACLILNAGTPDRREKLAGMFWPDTSDENARRNLRQELWRIRKAISAQAPAAPDYLLTEEITIAFDPNVDYWLDVAQFERTSGVDASASELMQQLALYRGDLLPGFYDDWVVLERERLQARHEQLLQALLERLIAEQLWSAVVEWSERWIASGQTPEPAYRALLLAYGAHGDRAKVVSTYQRCKEALEKELGVEPSYQTRDLCEQMLRGQHVADVDLTPRYIAAPHPVSTPVDEGPTPGEPPFKGLDFFDVDDAPLFFGRELLTASLVAQLRENPRLLVVIGASGSGKSSIVRAGLIPALRKGGPLADGSQPPEGSDHWQVHVITPTAHPLEALASSFTRDAESVTATATLMDDLGRDPRSLYLFLRRQTADLRRQTAAGDQPSSTGGHPLLVVDQFEELFTLCRDEYERVAFIDNLMTAIAPSAAFLLTLVIAIRADFYPQLAQYPELRLGTARQQDYIGPMTLEELRSAIEEPARCGGWDFEAGLVDVILRDLGDEPGALPLLSHALLETWKRRRGRTMTLTGYADSGGVRGAIAQTAETTYRQLTPEQQVIARNIFLRLTELGEGSEDTRRRAKIAELVPRSEEEASVRSVLQLLADARLVTLGAGTAEVAHEALIREWPMLREWLTQDREGLRLHRHITEAAHEWDLLERDPSALYRGARLAQAMEWASANVAEVNAQERAFLDASQELAKREEVEREAQRRRELEAARKLAEEQGRRAEAETERARVQAQRAEEQGRAAKQLRQRAIFLAGAFVLAIVLAGIALFFGDQARQSAVAAQANGRVASAREYAAAANSQLGVDPERSILLALQAIETTSADKQVLPEAEEALHRAIQASHIQFTLSGFSTGVLTVAYNSDGTRLVAISQDGTIKGWDTTNGKELFTVTGHTAYQQFAGVTLAYSPNGSQLATSDGDKVHIWDISAAMQGPALNPGSATPKEVLTLRGHAAGIQAIAYSPDGTRIATGGIDNAITVWDAATGKELLTLAGHKSYITGLAFSPDGKRIASASNDQTVRIWDVATGQVLMTLTGYINGVSSVAFSPDGKLVATASQDGTTHIWNASTGALVNLFANVESGPLAFSPDGSRLAMGNASGSTTFLDAATGRILFSLAGHKDAVNQVAFSPDGKHFASGSADGTAKIWDITPDRELFTLTNNGVAINRVAFSPDGTRIVTGGDDGSIKIWDAATGGEQLTIPGEASGVYGFSFSPDGRRLAAAYRNQVAKVWDLTGKLLLTLRGHTDWLRGVAFSPDGKSIATAGFDKTIKLWDAETGKELLTLADPNGGVTGIAFSPDGTRIAASYVDGRGVVWDIRGAKPLFTLTGHTGIVWTIDYDPLGKLIATASADKTVKVWDASNGKEVYTFRGHSSPVWRVVFSRDGTRLASGSTDQTAMVWDPTTGARLQILPGHSSGVYGLAFSPDGTRLLTASDDGTARVYLLKIDELMALAKSRLTRTWTLEECQQFLHLDQCPPTP
jgi:WD40 repeat protein/DNA-binding SARP family transcriptional activator